VNYLQEVDPGNTNTLRQLAAVHQQQGHWSQAAACYRRLAQAEPGSTQWPRELQFCLDQAMPNAKGNRPFAEQTEDDFDSAGCAALEQACGLEALSGRQRRRSGDGGARPGLAQNRGRNSPPKGSVDPLRSRDSGFDRNFEPDVGTPYRPGKPGGIGGNSFAQAGSNDRWGPIESDPGHYRPPFGLPGSAPIQSLLREANRLLEGRRIEPALQEYRKIISQAPDSVEASRDLDIWIQAAEGLCRCYQELRDHGSAVEACRQVLSRVPDSLQANLLMVEVVLAAGRPPSQADQYLRRASELASRRSVDRSIRSRLQCAAAEVALVLEDHKKAAQEASIALRDDPNDAGALLLSATAKIRIADYEAALRNLDVAKQVLLPNRGREAQQKLAQAHALAAQAQERLRRYPEALDEARRALDLDPHRLDAKVVRATALQQSGRDGEAESELEAVVSKDPSMLSARVQLGYLQLSANDPRSVKTLEMATNSTPHTASKSLLGAAKVYLALALEAEDRRFGRSHNQSGRSPIQVLREGLTLHVNLQCVWRELEKGACDRPVAAVQRLRGICDLDLTSIQARHLLQLLYRSSGRTDAPMTGYGTPLQEGASTRGCSPSFPHNRGGFPGFGDGVTPSTTAAGTPNQYGRSGSLMRQSISGQGRGPPLGETRTVANSNRVSRTASPQRPPASTRGNLLGNPDVPGGSGGGCRNLPNAPPPSWCHNGVSSSSRGQNSGPGYPTGRDGYGQDNANATGPLNSNMDGCGRGYGGAAPSSLGLPRGMAGSRPRSPGYGAPAYSGVGHSGYGSGHYPPLGQTSTAGRPW